MQILAGLLPWVIVFAVFWFIFIRPQKKKQEQYQKMLSELELGDKIVTIGGIKGKITDINDETLDIEIAPEVVVNVTRRAIGRLDGEEKEVSEK